MGKYTTSNDKGIDNFWGGVVELQDAINKHLKRRQKPMDVHPKPTTAWGKDYYYLNVLTAMRISREGRKIEVL